MVTALVVSPSTPSVLAGLLPTVFADDPDERLVTDTLLDRVDIEHLIDGVVMAMPRSRAWFTVPERHRSSQA